MRKIYKLLVPTVIAVALLASYASTMDDTTTAKDGAAEKVSYLPPKSTLSVPPRG